MTSWIHVRSIPNNKGSWHTGIVGGCSWFDFFFSPAGLLHVTPASINRENLHLTTWQRCAFKLPLEFVFQWFNYQKDCILSICPCLSKFLRFIPLCHVKSYKLSVIKEWDLGVFKVIYACGIEIIQNSHRKGITMIYMLEICIILCDFCHVIMSSFQWYQIRPWTHPIPPVTTGFHIQTQFFVIFHPAGC